MNEVDLHISKLRNYVSVDRNIRHHKSESDFEQFCESHCQDIEFLICAYENVARELLARGK